MYLDNVGFNAVDPVPLGRFWEQALGTRTVTDHPDIFETRLSFAGSRIDLCFARVEEAREEPMRLHLDLHPGQDQRATADRLRDLGARDLDIGQGDVPWIVLADPEDTPFCVLEPRDELTDTGAVAAMVVDSADPGRDAAFWSWLTGWDETPGRAPRTLRHPSGTGPLLEMCQQARPKGTGKNRLHLDVRLEAGDDGDEIAAGIAERGGRELHPDWGELPWRVYADPSGNEFCVLPQASGAGAD